MAGSGVQRLAAGDTLGVVGWYGGATVTITANTFHTFLRIRVYRMMKTLTKAKYAIIRCCGKRRTDYAPV